MIELRKATTLSWRKFLSTPEGQEGLLFLRERVPSIQPGDSHSIIFNAGVSEGYKRGIDTISEVLTLEQKPQDQDLENR